MTSRSSIEMLASKFDLPTGLLRAEQRLAERALRCWLDAGETEIPGFEAQGLVIVDPAGRAEISRIGGDIMRTFRLAPGQMLALDPTLPPHSLGAELCAACDLVVLGARPVPFEASLTAGGRGHILARGIALPIPDDRVQIVMSWREVLSRSAAARLRRELGRALESRPGAAPDAVDPLPIGRQAPMLPRAHE
ncbi:hypothetical protein [Polymorphobacter sp.]|uniref:hypothetical protein n=1 Tax=Polymorphobacter sp. TaxID=1909290 RepID=UPI003F72D0FF